jgi:phosphoribosylamine--glycine ligase
MGPNTGGMGAVAPLSDVTPALMDEFKKKILEPTVNGLIAENYDYRGFIFFGVMLSKNGPMLLEYNVRLGDPETQAVLPLMDSDFAELCKAITDGTLAQFDIRWKKGFVVAPVAVSGGYPAKYQKGYSIRIIPGALSSTGAKLFIAGAINERRHALKDAGDSGLVTSGGRVFACSAFGSTFDLAREKAYCALKAVKFKDMYYRKDIGLPGAADSPAL